MTGSSWRLTWDLVIDLGWWKINQGTNKSGKVVSSIKSLCIPLLVSKRIAMLFLQVYQLVSQLFLLICGQQWSWNLTIRYLDQLYLTKKVWHGMPLLLNSYSVLLIEMLSEMHSHTLPRNLWRIWLWIWVQSTICWSAELRDDTYEGWVSANGTIANVSENNSIKECENENREKFGKEEIQPSSSAMELLSDKGVVPNVQEPRENWAASFDFEDLEQLMSEIGNVRDSSRLMPDFQSR